VETINLNRPWQIGDALASGGFGRVYEAQADDGSPAVVKLVPKEPGAARELLFEPISGLPHIIPVLDSGEWGDFYALVMPRAEKSLRQHLEDTGGRLSVDETVVVLLDIAEALAALQQGVVHRDLKPENVLLYQGHWCLADFGIARYAEATTAPDTRKYMMTWPYAAPEQWRAERATSATDVYAFGVMAFELLQGHRPFPGPDDSDFRLQHLTQAPPPLSGCPPSIASLVTECLLKPPEARPTPANILARLNVSLRPPSPAAARLQAVDTGIAEKRGETEAAASAQRSREEKRRELFEAAQQSFRRILDVLLEQVREAAPSATVSPPPNLEIHLGDGALVVNPVGQAPADCLAVSGYEPSFDVIAYTAIGVRKPRDRFEYEGRSHSLWFCDAHEEDVYRWYELAFMVTPLIAQRFTLDPFALAPTDRAAAVALTPITSERQVAWAPIPFDQSDEDQFIERWMGWLAAAAEGTLGHPSHMPESTGGTWRRPQQQRR
jgi:hypothetical protein